MHPAAGGLPLSRLPGSLARIGLNLGDDDMLGLADLLLGSRRGVDETISWEDWSRVFGGVGPHATDGAVTERRRRLTLGRLEASVRHAVGANAPQRFMAWFAARDVQRSGRVGLSTFVQGLQAHGVFLSESDAALSIAELDPRGGGATLEYAKLGALLAEGPAGLPMPS
jgi:hypothetical protein